MALLARCSNKNCARRRTLKRPPSEYLRPPKCAGCGGRRYYLDHWQERRNAALRCTCEGYWFTHRRGSKWCLHAVGTVTLDDMVTRYGGEKIDYVMTGDARIREYEQPTEKAPF